MRVGIITLSDSAFLGQREDESGAAIEKIMQESKYQVVHRSVLPDSRRKISEALKELCDSRQLDLIVTTGGTLPFGSNPGSDYGYLGADSARYF